MSDHPTPGAGGAHEPHAERTLHDGVSDGLEALEPLDLSRVGSADDLVRAMARTAFAGRTLGEAADILQAMVEDEGCLVVCTLSGAMTVAKMGLVLCDMIDDGWVDVIVSTGALMAHGFVEATGRSHFKWNPEMDDAELFEKGYDRVYDTLELEQSLDDVEVIVREVLAGFDEAGSYSSAEFHRELGRWLDAHTEDRGILKSAFRRGVPVYVPAFTDSEIGLDIGLYRRRARMAGQAFALYEGFRDLEDYTDRVWNAERLGIFTVGGGVPRNWAQQVSPYLDIMRGRLEDDSIPQRRFEYGVRLCPEPAHWGGLSGCTYSEGVSWGKFVHPRDGGRYAEVLADATVTWPLLVKAVQERLGRR
jgi:deoxyhypusine synthase